MNTSGEPLDLEDEPLDLELLGEFFGAIAAGKAPTQAALEEAELALEPLRARAERALRRRAALAVFDGFRAEHPLLSIREAARAAARRTGSHAETVRTWVMKRGAGSARRETNQGT